MNHDDCSVLISAESEAREYQKKSSQNSNGHTNGNGKTPNIGIHTFENYLDYATARNPGKDTAQTIGLARWMQTGGSEDEAVAVWLKLKQSPAKKPKLPVCTTCGGRGFNRHPKPDAPMNNEVCETCSGKGHALQAAV